MSTQLRFTLACLTDFFDASRCKRGGSRSVSQKSTDCLIFRNIELSSEGQAEQETHPGLSMLQDKIDLTTETEYRHSAKKD